MKNKKAIPGRGKQRGLSLVELSISLAIAGVASLATWQYVTQQHQRDTVVHSSSAAERAQLNLQMFAALHGRLPCPARDADGQEQCTTLEPGQLPWRTIGLPDPAAGKIGYTVTSPMLVGEASFRPLVPLTAKDKNLTGAEVTLQSLSASGTDRVLDLCSALMTSAPAGGELAYSVAARSETAAAANEAPASSIAVSRGQLGANLGCGNLLAVAGRSHFNAWLASSVMSRAIEDYQTQAELAFGVTKWNMGHGAVSLFMQFATNRNSLDDARIAFNAVRYPETEDPVSLGRMITAYAIALTGPALDAAVIGLAVTNFARATDNVIKASQLQSGIAALRGQIDQVQASTGRHAIANASSAWFLAEQQRSPDASLPAATSVPVEESQGGDLGRLADQWLGAMGKLP